MKRALIPADRLQDYIWEGISKKVYPDRIELCLPFVFGNGSSDPLCLTWTEKGVLTDNGRTLTELKKRLGDIAPFKKDIERIVAHCGDFKLAGGQKLVLPCRSSAGKYLSYALQQMLQAISLILVVDTVRVYPPWNWPEEQEAPGCF